MGFTRQEYWSGLPCPPPEDLPDAGVKPVSLVSPALTGSFFTTMPPGKPVLCITHLKNNELLCNFTCNIYLVRNNTFGSFYGINKMTYLITQSVKNLPAVQETWVQFLGQKDPLEKVMATHCSVMSSPLQPFGL